MDEIQRTHKVYETYSKEHIDLAAKVGHGVLQAVADTFNLYHMPQWELCPVWYKARITANVEQIIHSARSCHNLHDKWYRRSIAEGMTLGERNRELNTHPHLVPFNDLPIEIKHQWRVFRAAIMAFRINKGPGFHPKEEKE